MGRRILAGEDAVPALGHRLAVQHQHRAERLSLAERMCSKEISTARLRKARSASKSMLIRVVQLPPYAPMAARAVRKLAGSRLLAATASRHCKSCAATAAAITAGSLPPMPGTPMGHVRRARALSASPASRIRLTKRTFLMADPIRPTPPRSVRCSAAVVRCQIQRVGMGHDHARSAWAGAVAISASGVGVQTATALAGINAGKASVPGVDPAHAETEAARAPVRGPGRHAPRRRAGPACGRRQTAR